MALVTPPKNCDVSVRKAIQQLDKKLGPTSVVTHTNITLTDLTASSLIGTNASKLLESVTVGTGLDYTRPNLTLSHLGIEALTDAGADKAMFWDDTASACKWLGMGNSIAITDVTIDTIQDIRTTASPAFTNLSLGTGELTAGSINRAAGTLTLEIAGTAEISISSTTITVGGNLVIPDTGYIGSTSDTNAIQIAANGEVSFTDVATGILPTAGAHLATKEYVDLAIGASADFFLSNNDDAVIADYHILYETDTGEASSTLVTDPMVENDDQLMFSYITASGVPGVEFLRAGVYICHSHLSRGTGDKPTTFYWTLSKYTIGDVETVILTSEESSAIPDSTISFQTHATLAADTAILVTDRLVLKLYANVGAAGGNSEVTISMEGTHDSYLTNLLPSSIWQNQSDALDSIAALGAIADNEFIVGTGAGTYAHESGATARTSLGLGNVEDTTLSTWAGTTNITTLGTIVTGVWEGTSIAVTYTDAKCTDATADNTAANQTSHADVLVDGDVGVGVQAFGAALNDLSALTPPASDGQFIVATGVGAFQYESGATARTSIGLGTGNTVQFNALGINTVPSNKLHVNLGTIGTIARFDGAGDEFFGIRQDAENAWRFYGYDTGSSSFVNFVLGNYNLYIDAINDRISICTGGSAQTPVTKLTVEGALTLKEQAAADGDTATYGQHWVKNTVPCTPWFTDDDGNDGQFMLMRSNSISADSDAADVQGCNVLWVDTSGDDVVLGGLANGVDNQLLYVFKYGEAGILTIEHQEGTGTQKFMMNGADIVNNGVGICLPFICKNGTWYIAAYPRSFSA